MRTQVYGILFVLGTLLLGGCQSSLPVPQMPATPPAAHYRISVITGSNITQQNHSSQLMWQGIERAQASYPLEATLTENVAAGDAAAKLQAITRQSPDLIVLVGQSIQEAGLAAVSQNPSQRFAIVDHGGQAPNLSGLQFDVVQPAFLAGYLAAGVSTNGIVCTSGGGKLYQSTVYMGGFANGVHFFNLRHGADVAVLGWNRDTQLGALNQTGQSVLATYQVTDSFLNAGCDVLFSVNRVLDSDIATMAKERDVAVIGVGVDWFDTAPAFESIWLTSVQKNLDQAMFDTITALANGRLQGGDDYLGTLANHGVGLANFHHWAHRIPSELQAELDDLEQSIISGALDPMLGKQFVD